ncbi:hypothetical protein FRACYDRAFT_246404 [Fragilariopsis cylindrus CCMP1102]|uniref:MYND-type domain-containing protein n=1 Tax=Fragilariopsis cylindrus CCMP1102 TaxID=635003 RepID=A0A1E7EZ58_9STRA|nr:hypothetical protein FRACYDRAFT_246404 [Fragilariopsis cylindrus CCMP1102]|eukprot:OEU11290.1 hypothetical protein FRACYDRAFT_246404 [Fragilariopsis cylindrus CCMP1102]
MGSNTKSDDVTIRRKDEYGYPLDENFDLAQQYADKRNMPNEVLQHITLAAQNGCVAGMRHHGRDWLYTISTIDDTCTPNLRTIHLALPWLLEGAIRGHPVSIKDLTTGCYVMAKHGIAITTPITTTERVLGSHKKIQNNVTSSANTTTNDDDDDNDNDNNKATANGLYTPYALCCYWLKMSIKWEANSDDKKRIISSYEHMRDKIRNRSNGGGSGTLLKTCKSCAVYSYCSKQCQKVHWFQYGHNAECNQLKILKKYHQPYCKEIRKGCLRGDSPHTIIGLQKLRTKLGLSRERDLSDEYLGWEGHAGNQNTVMTIDPCDYLVARKGGTVHLGSILKAKQHQSVYIHILV